ncbi:MAG: hypothetical protein VB858_01645 [Planctomycetaceae bacterium]
MTVRDLFFGGRFMIRPGKLTTESEIALTAGQESAHVREPVDRLRTVWVLQTGRDREAGD